MLFWSVIGDGVVQAKKLFFARTRVFFSVCTFYVPVSVLEKISFTISDSCAYSIRNAS